MPEYLQGDIFQIATQGNYDLAIVFGHTGFNQMKIRWDDFRERLPGLKSVGNPFVEYARTPQELLPGRWFWFVPEGANHGMSDDQVESALRDAVWWAMKRFGRPTRIITNGIAETGEDANRDRRARFLAELAAGLEGCGFRVSLISLNDVFASQGSP
jgi:hypothetical protein